jgi:hypothetical protein
VLAALRGDDFLGLVVLALQRRETLLRLDRVRSVIRIVVIVVVVVLRRLLGDLLRRGDVFRRVEVADQDVCQLAFFLGDQGVLVEDLLHGAGIEGQGGHQFADAFLDALGDDDLALAGQQFNGAHLAHVHAYRVRGAAGLGFHGGKGRGGLGGGDVVGGAIAFREQELIRIGCLFEHLDAHVVDHLDDVFDLVRIGNIVGQVVVDLGVGQVALFLSFGNQGLQTRLLGHGVVHQAPCM